MTFSRLLLLFSISIHLLNAEVAVTTASTAAEALSTDAPEAELVTDPILLVNGKINPPVAGKRYTINTLRKIMKKGVAAGSADFSVLSYNNTPPFANGTPVPVDQDGKFQTTDQILNDPTKLASMGVNFRPEINLNGLVNTPFVVREDADHINRLANPTFNRLGPNNRAQYQKIMLFIVVPVGGTYYKLYLNDPWPGIRRGMTSRSTAVNYPADEIIKKHNI